MAGRVRGSGAEGEDDAIEVGGVGLEVASGCHGARVAHQALGRDKIFSGGGVDPGREGLSA